MKSNYRRLGDFIEEIDIRNSDGSITSLKGVTLEKTFINSVANTIGTDLTKYKVVEEDVFACSLMQVSRDGGVAIALYKEKDNSIVSPAYYTFKTKRDLLPEYLEIILSDKEFDRQAVFYAVGGVRGTLEWEDFCNLKVNIPDIKKQEKIVNNKNKIRGAIQKLQEEDKLILNLGKMVFEEKYKSEECFEEEISINEFCVNIGSGATPSRSEEEYWNRNDIPWLKNGEVKNNIILDTEEYISKKGFDNSSVRIFPEFSVNMAMYCVSDIQASINTIPLCSNQAVLNFQTNSLRESSILFFYLYTYGNDITQEANGSAQQNLSKDFISGYMFKKPNVKNKDFDIFERLINRRIIIAKAIANLERMALLV